MKESQRILTAALAVCLLMSTALVPGAGAYPQHPNICNDDVLEWQFGVGWDATTMEYAREAIDTLDDALDYDGTKLITVTETEDAPIILNREIIEDGAYGSATCFGLDALVILNSEYSEASFIYKVVRHEMFHLAGALHAGQYDSLDGRVPTTMATCRHKSEFLSTNLLTRDDHQYENWLHSSLADRQLHANMGFEQGTSFWQKSDPAAGMTVVSPGGATGPAYAHWDVMDISEFLFQTTRVIVGDDNEQYRVRVNAKSHDPDYSTVLGAHLYVRTLDLPNHPDGPDPGCIWPDGIIDANGVSFPGTYMKMAEIPLQLIGTAWAAFTSDWATPPEEFEAYEFQVRFSGNSQYVPTGHYAEIHVDNVRGEGT